MRDRTMHLAMLTALAIYGLAYWSLQPICEAGEVRVRSFFMTACVAGH
jgi:hypothetical protein